VSIVLDASAALKLVLEEEGSDRVRELVIGAETLIAPDFLMLEASNVLAIMARRNLITQSDAQASLDALAAAPIRFAPSQPHFAEAYRLAVNLGRSAYDSLYLALALSERGVLVTADRRFAEAVQREPAYVSAIRLL
jgi:predicted nucleic acid-binding protein